MAARIQSGSVTILDRPAMARAAAWIIKNKGNSWSTVDPSIRRLQPLLSRLSREKLATISVAVFKKLIEILYERGRQGRLAQSVLWAVLTPHAFGALAAYEYWLDVWVTEEYPMPGPPFDSYVMAESGPQPGPALTRDDHQRLFGELMLRVTRDPRARLLYERFIEFAKRRGHSEERISLAVYRAVEPIIQAPYTAFIERSADERTPDPLTLDELREFLSLGLERERILLKRPSDTIRAQQLVSVPVRTSSEMINNSIRVSREKGVRRR